MKKVLVLVAAAAGAAYAKRKIEQQRSEKDLHAATSRMGSIPKPAGSGGAWAAASDRPS
ncbi:DLW-39 family protein [Janibacter sp. Soil728]|uniref:DLW-39 family protein n=1 Tax=Janibacter sp. Soil728 TaxID=1736393 RepID=UPI000A9EC1E3|nr:DLW-39 family protein [Janibacter sp. Soil728]